MALKAILEIVLQLDSFRNVDLTKQGLYQVQIAVYGGGEEDRQYAGPYELMGVGMHCKSMSLLPARMDDHTDSLCSSTVLIRFCDEEMKMTDACVFRLELGLTHPPQLTLEARLLFSDLNGDLNFDAPLTQLRSITSIVDFTTLETAVLKIQNPFEGVHQYAQFVFPNPHMSVLALTVHTALMDYRVRVTTPLSDLELPKTIAKFLFSKDDGQLKVYVGSDETDKKYGQLVTAIAHCHENLRQFVSLVLKKCVGQDVGHLFGDIPGTLTLPLYRAPFTSAQPKKFSEAVSSHDPLFVSAAVLTEVNLIAGQVFTLFHAVKTLIKTLPNPIVAFLRENYLEAVKDRCGESIFRDSHVIHSCPLTADSEIIERHKAQAITQRRNRYYCHLTPMPVHDPGLFPSPEDHPILFEDNYINPGGALENQKAKGVVEHVIVLVHGYQGNSFDMRIIRNSLSLVYPQALFLCSAANEDSTEGCILSMGLNLAREIVAFVEEWCPNGKLGKLSFVAHSLGGLIVRAALPHLQNFADKMYSFVSLSCPHLGYMYPSSKLVDAGMWLLKAWNKSLCLKQLSMSEERNPYQSVLYRLSGYFGLSWFKHIVLLASHQDQYAPFESARIEVSPKAATDPINGKAYIEMATRMLGELSPSQVCRLDVSFKIASKNIDSFIGRTAHIQFLENEGFLRMVAFRYPEFFR